MPPSFPGRCRGSGAAPVPAKASKHLVSNILDALLTKFFGVERRNIFKLSHMTSEADRIFKRNSATRRDCALTSAACPERQRLKMENGSGAGPKIVLCAAVKIYAKSREVIDEDWKIIELDRADRKDAGNSDVNASSHGQRKGILPEREFVVADYGDQ